jgi:hypothetical protein
MDVLKGPQRGVPENRILIAPLDPRGVVKMGFREA